jgi:GNAT superfamily N-acetyltransferase
MAEIEYLLEPKLTVGEFVDVLRRSTLAERRPVDDARTMAEMLAHADVIVTARDSRGLLVGVSRAITDFSYCTYLSDLAVDEAFQRQGIGRELIRRTHLAAGFEDEPHSPSRAEGRNVLPTHRNVAPQFLLANRTSVIGHPPIQQW